MKHILITILAAGLSVAAVAADNKAEPELSVDLAVVVSTGEVIPVDGMSSAGQPDEAALAVFARQGYTRVIDLRTEDEDRGFDEPTAVENAGMEYVSLPIGREDITFEKARSLDMLIKSSNGPVLVHCGSGNRVGALLALSKSLEGADDDEALQYGRQGGMTRLEGQVKEVLSEE